MRWVTITGAADDGTRIIERAARERLPDRPAHDTHHNALNDFRRRFVISTILTIPILLLSEPIQGFLGITGRFPGSEVILIALATAVYLYGGWPFLTDIVSELRGRGCPG